MFKINHIKFDMKNTIGRQEDEKKKQYDSQIIPKML